MTCPEVAANMIHSSQAGSLLFSVEAMDLFLSEIFSGSVFGDFR